MREITGDLIEALKQKVDELSLNLERMKLAEYVELLNKPKRLLLINFISGVARGLGIAVGFTLLGALVLFILQRLVVLNLPVVSDFIATLVRLVQLQLEGKI
ncbi:putative membrane protein [Thermacetogenium phaeum DSM 12270]|jgi:hypothetical protein|uniref:Putative membrane protein n=2 Tax=Thermacetogenium phaeum TaxID=85874 RepID=K4LU03_THEPS|nr:DUF5665 domain-containing protein [Thermacetogenium phaeum]AFV11514.1 putative membrane protein [Thermacetogenium phaeum DSM 12270]KUK36116.1 MAG: Putative membrane protein [Thermacetogenium phaeum]MDN5365176.1 hypothetical protein [Thermacetogenium sp.]